METGIPFDQMLSDRASGPECGRSERLDEHGPSINVIDDDRQTTGQYVPMRGYATRLGLSVPTTNPVSQWGFSRACTAHWDLRGDLPRAGSGDGLKHACLAKWQPI